VYAFRGLDGLIAVEQPDEPEDWSLPSTPTVPFAVAATDPGRRFLPMVLTVDVPHLGLVTAADVVTTSVPSEAPVYLFSSVGRVLPAGTAGVRARLSGLAGTPLAFAIIEVREGPRRWIGVSDRDGQAVVPFPWPAFGGAFAASVPPGTTGTPSVNQAWPITVSVRSDVSALDFVTGLPEPGAEWPTLASLSAQPARSVVDIDGQTAVPFVTRTLQYGHDLVVATTGPDESSLLVDGVNP
jgi:hypothetical protein